MALMRFGSVCSGIEAASAAWHPLGWAPAFFSEIEAFPCAVLKHHYPTVPNFGDMTKFKEWPDAALDVLVGGTPCQSFSVAGLRKGLDDPRGNLMLTFGAIAARYRPRWLVWENVPGVLSSGGGRDFGTFLGMLAELGYGFAYRVLDAQHFGVPQRRRRVFVVGYLGDWRRAASVLLERESLQGNPAPSREAGERPAPTISARTKGGGGLGTDFDCDGGLIPETVGALTDGAHNGGDSTVRTPTPGVYLPSLANPLTARMGKGINTTCDEGQTMIPVAGGGFDVAHAIQAGATRENPNSGPDGVGVQANVAYTLEARAEVQMVAHSLRADGFDASEDGTGRGTPLVPVAFTAKDYGADAGELAPTLRAGGHSGSHANGGVMPAIAFAQNQRDEVRQMEVAGALAAEPGAKQQTYLATGVDVYNSQETGDVAATLGASQARQNGSGPQVMTSAVRRLTPRECERLQGFPLTWKSITITACIDQQKHAVRVALSCRKWQSDALPVVVSAFPQPAEPAADHSGTRLVAHDPLAAVVVHTNSVDELHALHSRGRLLWSANGATVSSSFHLPIPAADIARVAARLLRELDHSIIAGEAELLLNEPPSSPVENGAEPAGESGHAMLGSVGDAVSAQNSGLFTTSDLGRLHPTCDSPTATWCCSALRAIAGFIPDETLPETFSVELTVGTPYTLIPHRGKPAADGPRYKALGNSMAVPVMAWLGRRIQAVEAVKSNS